LANKKGKSKRKDPLLDTKELAGDMQSPVFRVIAIVIGLVLIAVGVLGLTLYWDIMGAITAEDYVDQLNYGHSNQFGQYSDGDIIIIRDKVDSAEYEGNSTIITFESDKDYNFKIEGDHEELENKKVILSLKVVSVEGELGGETYTYETIEDMGDDGELPEDSITPALWIDLFFYLAIMAGFITMVWGIAKYARER